MRFDPLPESAAEVSDVAELLSASGPASQTSGPSSKMGVQVLTDHQATEQAFRSLAPSSRLLHLATHGFFLGGDCARSLPGDDADATGLAAENPLLLSGLALAGANLREHAGPDEEDGILTAEEIASLDLSGVEWAVLSACDTGVGEVRAGEGVFGLRRAFQVAGARTLIMSLWPVEDEATRAWMRELYTKRFVNGMTTIDSVHEASLALLEQRREAGLSTHPFYWAGFIASGDGG
jgi:CHAT domain-containing protein